LWTINQIEIIGKMVEIIW